MRRLIRKIFIKPLLALGYRWQFLRDNFLWRSIKPYYHYYVDHARDFSLVSNGDAASFFDKNAERVKAVASVLADEESKKIYLGMVKFRQTHCKKDYPFHAFREEQYFIKKLKLGKDEIFVDCGAFTGDTIDLFLRRCKEYKQIIAFEPDPEIFERLKKKHGGNKKITFINAGVYDKDGEISFGEDSGGCLKIMDDKDGGFANRIQVKTIDGLNLENVSFIKMDIEGAELNALKGAEKTILRDKPKLAVCIYHSDEDMIRIAEYIHKLIPEYKLYVRHYGFITETVLYAITAES
jgi:FkbM family methyltransferase